MINPGKYAFVFAACGNDKHIDALNFSLIPLAKRTKHPIYVVTDKRRNGLIINWDKVIDIETPKEYNHHQAAIYLKTGLHKFLPADATYCYLDTDVLAIGNYVDAIFEEFSAPVNFALDQYNMRSFSSMAVKCDCDKRKSDYERRISEQLNKADEFRLMDDHVIQEARLRFERTYKSIGSRIRLHLKLLPGALLPIGRLKIDKETSFDFKNNVLVTAENVAFMRNYSFRKLLKNAGYKWNWIKREPELPNGLPVAKIECDHLREAIQSTFSVDVKERCFHHYNGGVFLFNNASHAFLDFWHTATLRIFNEPFWKTRDQGTLIAAVWNFGIQSKKPLHRRWNFGIDYNDPDLNLEHIMKQHFKNDPQNSPQFLHVFHHFNDCNWDAWNEIEKLL